MPSGRALSRIQERLGSHDDTTEQWWSILPVACTEERREQENACSSVGYSPSGYELPEWREKVGHIC